MRVFIGATLVEIEPSRSVVRTLQESGAAIECCDYTNLTPSEVFAEHMDSADIAIFVVDGSWKGASAMLFRWLMAVRLKRLGRLKRLVRYDLADPGPALDHMLSGKVEYPFQGEGTSVELWHAHEFDLFLETLRAETRSTPIARPTDGAA